MGETHPVEAVVRAEGLAKSFARGKKERVQALAGAELVSAWDATTPDGWRMGPVAGMDFLIPYLQRFRLCLGWSRQQGGVVSFGFGLEEKTVAQRWKGR